MLGRGFIALHLVLFGIAAPPGDWHTCGGLPDALENVACPWWDTCCTQNWSPSNGSFGCVPEPEAVCCPGGYTACPKGTRCVNHNQGYRIVSTCVPADGGTGKQNVTGVQVCKQGAPLPPSIEKKNVLILGDSVSIGYTPFVNESLADVALVQHTPWGGDGGAEETEYGFQCLEYLLRAPDGSKLWPDVLYFNFGLHNIHVDEKVPGQAGLPEDYAPFLEKVVAKLSQWSSARRPLNPDVKLVFGLTTPMLGTPELDKIVIENNEKAREIMYRYSVHVVDMHAAVVAKCGPVPQKECFGSRGCFDPHCSPAGYEWLANSTIAPAIRRELARLDNGVLV